MSHGTCTVQINKGGNFCDAPGAPDMPFPICKRHAVRLYLRMMEHVQSGLAITPEAAEATRKRMEFQERAKKSLAAGQSVVYYLKMPSGRVKIGYSTNLRERLTALRVKADAVLATEPGNAQLERRRHRQFASLRYGRWEEFEHTPELDEFIAKVRARNGEPNITTYPKVMGKSPAELADALTADW